MSTQKTFRKLKDEGFFWKLEPDEELAEVEPRVRHLVEAINDLPYAATYSSCHGHRHPPISPYVSFYVQPQEAVDFLSCLKRLPRLGVEDEFEPHPEVEEASIEPLKGVEITFRQFTTLTPKDFKDVIKCTENRVSDPVVKFLAGI